MGVREDLTEAKVNTNELKEQVNELKEHSLAEDVLHFCTNVIKKMFIIIIVLMLLWFTTIGLFVYYINTTGYEITTESAETNDGGNACVGNNCNNGEVNYGEGFEGNEEES